MPRSSDPIVSPGRGPCTQWCLRQKQLFVPGFLHYPRPLQIINPKFQVGVLRGCLPKTQATIEPGHCHLWPQKSAEVLWAVTSAITLFFLKDISADKTSIVKHHIRTKLQNLPNILQVKSIAQQASCREGQPLGPRAQALPPQRLSHCPLLRPPFIWGAPPHPSLPCLPGPHLSQSLLSGPSSLALPVYLNLGLVTCLFAVRIETIISCLKSWIYAMVNCSES